MILISLSFLICCLIFSLSLLNYNLSNSSKSGLSGFVDLKKFNKFLVYLFFISLILFTILTVNFKLYSFGFVETNFLNYIPEGQASSTPQDPNRWWPSGVPQSIVVMGSMIGAFAALGKVHGITPRMRVLASLGAGGVTGANVAYHSAIENSMGFNRFMFSLNRAKRTGEWPSIDEMYTNSKASDESVEQFCNQAVSQADQSVINNAVSEAQTAINSNNGGCKFTSGNEIADILYNLFDNFMQHVGFMFKPVPVNGYLDDLIGQRIAIEFILLLTTIFLFCLILAYLINNLLFYNKEYFIKRFGQKNKFINIYLKYQVFCIKVSLFYLPLFMAIGFFVLFQGLYFLITHQIPYENLGIDLHVFVKSS